MDETIKKKIENIPFFESYDESLKKIKLKGVTKLPRALWELSDHIDILEANGGELSKLDNDFAEIGLKAAFFCRNKFKYTPEALYESKSTEIVAFYENDLLEIPEKTLSPETKWLMISNNPKLSSTSFLKDLKKIKKLAALNCGFQKLDPSVLELKELEFFRCGLNNFQEPIIELLYKLPKLAWFSDSENPYSFQPNLKFDSFSRFNEHQILEKSPLDAGNRSSIEKILIKDLGYHVLKTYDSSLSSDGSTLNEFLAAFCIGAECDATSKTIGSFYQGEKLQGIVQEIIPQNFKKLGNVPNFKTITRDTFGNHIALTNEFIKNVLRDVSYSCKYVFSKGVSHGDIYAHNVLANQTGNAKLIDWGAACMFDPNASEASKREKIEVRAFGYLIDDLLQLQPTKDENLYAIKNACLNLKASHRPSFKEISELLNKL